MSKIITDEKMLENSINFLLPANHGIVTDYIARAMDISKRYLSGIKRRFQTEDSMYTHALRVALTVAERSSKISETHFFLYQPIIVALLHDVIEDADCEELRKELEFFRTKDNYVLNGILALTNSSEGIKQYGRSKYMNMKFSELAKGDRDIFYVKLADRVDNLTCLSTIQDTEEYQNKKREAELFRRNMLLESLSIYQNFIQVGFAASIHNSMYTLFNEFAAIVTTREKF